jgi:iron complex outermembrane receptor protein
MNYGTSLGKKKVLLTLLSIKRSTGGRAKMQQELFCLQCTEQRAAEAGTNINSLFGNINTP